MTLSLKALKPGMEALRFIEAAVFALTPLKTAAPFWALSESVPESAPAVADKVIVSSVSIKLPY